MEGLPRAQSNQQEPHDPVFERYLHEERENLRKEIDAMRREADDDERNFEKRVRSRAALRYARERK